MLQMVPITVYAKTTCPYCHAAIALLRSKGAAFDLVDVTNDPAGQQAMSVRANGRRTVPQIFVGDTHVGGCDDLHALDAAGGLDPLLAG
jgi:glutaredoxin 3